MNDILMSAKKTDPFMEIPFYPSREEVIEAGEVLLAKLIKKAKKRAEKEVAE